MQPLFDTPYALARSGDFVVTVTPMAMVAELVCLAAALALLLLMRWSRFGRAWRACADDPLSAALFGIDARAVLLATFALASGLAGLAGFIVTIYYGTFGFAGGIVLGLKSLLAAVAGGIGSVPGAFLGGILLGSAESLWTALFPIEYRDVAVLSAHGAARPAPQRPPWRRRAAAAQGVTARSPTPTPPAPASAPRSAHRGRRPGAAPHR